MIGSGETKKVEMILMDHIVVVNPRVRNKKTFKEIVANIADIGLKKPITCPDATLPRVHVTTLSAVRGGWKHIDC